MVKANAHRNSHQKAFTLIELMVVVTIIAVLAALIVPALQNAQAKAMTMKCLSKAKAIATSVRAYASSWGGWTHPDAHSVYIRDAGWRAAWEDGYFGEAAGAWATDTSTQSYQHAVSKLRDYVCPVHEDPRLTRHAIASSYNAVSPFTGSNIMNLTESADKTLCVVEAGGNRHPSGEGETSRNFVYADLHATLGFDGDTSPGLLLKAWHTDTQTGILNVTHGDLPAAVYDTFSASLHMPGPWSLDLVGALDASLGYPNDWNNTTVTRGHTGPTWDGSYMNNIEKVVARLDGFIKFPKMGNWEFRIGSKGHYTSVWFSMGAPGGNPFNARSSASYATVTSLGNSWGNTGAWGQVTVDSADYHPFQFVYRSNVWSAGHHLGGGWELDWRRQDPDTPGAYDADYGGSTGQRIPDTVFSTLPF